ncbi:ParB/RepB/Spo0J family partition protein [Vibrio sp. SCSIO 43137]|uniref:ParB/RepB/Spo0J family partition protein n=1 Tax=Vibrio sp. SCSIO 43137 TaxID=3021011 RepID=UPI002307F3D8|nr:ParB/RepB/Spo0J family partition protein [Vibrio sp. SCSIO 43137]WCE29739.1 ParB/RepB/Spo0J family partition protein [Vibrio sp. SCSIO 43137]
MSKRGLGKGLDALLATSSLAREKQQIATKSQSISVEGDLAEIAVSDLKPGVYQPRKEMSEEALEELSASIQSQGIIQPIVVRPLESGGYEIIAGERRWRAARQAGLKQVPCVVKNVQDRAAIAMALIENIQREDLNVIEEAQALERLQDEFELTHQQVADVIGKSRTTVTNLLRLNQLDTEVKQLVEKKRLEMGHARTLLALKSGEQTEVAKIISDKQMTVRQAEQYVKKYLQPKASTEKVVDNEAVAISERLSQSIGSNVSLVRSSNGKSKMTITFDEPHKLEKLIKLLESH